MLCFYLSMLTVLGMVVCCCLLRFNVLVLLADQHRYDALGAAAKLYMDKDTNSFSFGMVMVALIGLAGFSSRSFRSVIRFDHYMIFARSTLFCCPRQCEPRISTLLRKVERFLRR